MCPVIGISHIEIRLELSIQQQTTTKPYFTKWGRQTRIIHDNTYSRNYQY